MHSVFRMAPISSCHQERLTRLQVTLGEQSQSATQVTLASILAGARFKYYDEAIAGNSLRLPTECQTCKARGSPGHIMSHMGVMETPTQPEEIIEFLGRAATTAETANPHISTPYLAGLADDFELDLHASSEESEFDELPIDEE